MVFVCLRHRMWSLCSNPFVSLWCHSKQSLFRCPLIDIFLCFARVSWISCIRVRDFWVLFLKPVSVSNMQFPLFRLVFFGEYEDMGKSQMFMFFVGILCTVSGLVMLSKRKVGASESRRFSFSGHSMEDYHHPHSDFDDAEFESIYMSSGSTHSPIPRKDASPSSKLLAKSSPSKSPIQHRKLRSRTDSQRSDSRRSP